jgi:hypothetical protein
MIAQWYSAGLRARWSKIRVPAATGNFSLHHRVQNGSGAHPASYPMCTRGFFPGSKAIGSWRGQEYVELYLYSPNTPSWRGAQLKKSDNFSFAFTVAYSYS